MADSNAIVTDGGRSIMLYRANTENNDLSLTQYLPLSRLVPGINGSTPNVADNTINQPVPIEDGDTIDDGSNNFTGSNGGDNSTDNTTTFKEGAGNTDGTAQNLIANNTSATKTWTLTLTTFPNTTDYTAPWFYIKDAAALAKFLSSGTCLEIKLGSDSSNYYSETYEASDLAVGWNFLNIGNLASLTETGTVTGDIDTFIIEITTNNATDEFVAGDVVYDLLRQWTDADTQSEFRAGFPSIDFNTLTVTREVLIGTTKLNGFFVNNWLWQNLDSTPIGGAIALVDGDSKSSTDQWKIIQKERVL